MPRDLICDQCNKYIGRKENAHLVDKKKNLDFCSKGCYSDWKNKNDKENQANWTVIHQDFAEKPYPYNKTYKQFWEEFFTYQDAREWIKVDFQPKDYEKVKNWKKQGFAAQQAREWIAAGLKIEDYDWANRAKNNGASPQQFAQFLSKFQQARKVEDWLDFFYPQQERVELTKLDISEKNLTGSLNLTDFPRLEELWCYDNQLTTLLLPRQLRILNANNNQLSDLTIFSQLVNLEKLNLSSNLITSGLECLPANLEKLYCDGELAGSLKAYDKGDYYDYQAWRKAHSTEFELIKANTKFNLAKQVNYLKKQLEQYENYQQISKESLTSIEEKYRNFKKYLNSLLLKGIIEINENNEEEKPSKEGWELIKMVRQLKITKEKLEEKNKELQEKINLCERVEKELTQKMTELETIRRKRKEIGSNKLTVEEIDKSFQLPEEIEELEKKLFEARKFLKEKGITININGSISVDEGNLLIGNQIGDNANFSYNAITYPEFQTHTLQPPKSNH